MASDYGIGMEVEENARRSRRSRRLHRHLKRSHGEELNIVSMIDVFAVLVFFLLVSSSIAAARLNVLGLNLPSNQHVSAEKPSRHVTVTLLKNELLVSDHHGETHRLPNTASGYNIAAMSSLLVRCKSEVPQDGNLTLLVDPDVAYEHVVAVMDAARFSPAVTHAASTPVEMFPQISVGLAS